MGSFGVVADEPVIEDHLHFLDRLVPCPAAFILIEISSSKPDPQQYLLEVGARLSGLAHVTARATKEGADTADYSSAEISTTIERVSAMIDAINGENLS